MQEQTTLIIQKEVFPFFNLSLYLNDIKPIRSLIVENPSDFDIYNVEVKISSDLPCLEPFSYSISCILAKNSVKIPLDYLQVNRNFFSSLSETEKTILQVEVSGQGILPICENVTINIHPLEHFGGFQILPELIAAYITPNHSYVYHIKRKAVAILEKQNLKTAFEGYQSNSSERVLQIISSLYSSIKSEEIIYSALPPGYEETGQRLRLLNTIQQEKFGNCIDLSLLFAACLEAVDLNPILIIVRGHAFVGCWLQDDKFSEIINDDKSAITKRVAKGIREIITLEATTLCKGNTITFSDALDFGASQLVEKEDFLLSVDIKRARTARIRPLPLLYNTSNLELNKDEFVQKEETAKMEKRFEIGTIYQDELNSNKQPITKQKIWERKLLDLSLRNSLLNLRITRNMLQLVDIDINHLEDTLSEGKSFSILSNNKAEVLKKYNLFLQALHSSSALYQMANEDLKYNRLHTYYHQQDLDNILTYIYSNAKQAIEENGSSTLYLAVGLLKWYQRQTPDQARYAPILLIPVEISRRSVNSKFTLKSREEETMVNITLIEFLRQEYELDLSSLEHLPNDEKGVDVAKVMGILRRAIMQLKGWDVEEQLVLGNFSFSKLILWKDIVIHQEDMLKNQMVKSLVEGKFSSTINSENIIESDINIIPSQSLTLPIPADISQIEAVLTAQKGLSFILHGPPGTGKSQTITNIIADALNRGKRVLFVAAKKAALDVVHKRLEQIGLSPFTLELHSNKSKKSDVLEQISKSLETARNYKMTDFTQESERLDTAKIAISDYVNLLHKQQSYGWSLYDSIIALEDFPNSFDSSNIIPENIVNSLSANQWLQWNDWLVQYETVAKLIEHPSKNPLSILQVTQYSQTVHDSIISQNQITLDLLVNLQQSIQTLSKAIYFPFPIQTKIAFQHFVQVINTLPEISTIPLTFIQYLSNKDNLEIYQEWSIYFQQYQDILRKILNEYNYDVLESNISTIEIQWKQAINSWFLPKWLGKKKVKKQLSIFRKAPFSSDDEVEQLFTNHQHLKDLKRVLQQSRFINVTQTLQNLYKDEETNILAINQKVSVVQRVNDLMSIWEYQGLVKWTNIFLVGNIVPNFGDLQQKNIVLIDDFKQILVDSLENIQKYEAVVGSFLQQNENWLNDNISQIKAIQLYLPKLKDWVNYKLICSKGRELQIEWLIIAFELNKCDINQITDYFQFVTHKTLVTKIIERHESLSLFNVELFESKIEQYKIIAKNYQKLTMQELRAKLSMQLPNTSIEAIQSSELGLLQRAIKNKGRGTSIRRLFDQIPTLLPRIAPCMLMSPISVAQYFDVDTKHFDLVIFDEASQLPTCEAVSALARAKQAIIVGDPKQMPPTSFFNTTKLDEENIEIEDLESILDDCLSLSVPSKYLLRHYRSKHESLIAFSNINYYENKLLTFPSADDLNRKVQYHHIKGFYDKGKTRTNKFEAEEIVQYIKSHYSDDNRKSMSLGVVTFSQTQQNLIEEKLQQLYITDLQLEQAATESEEPLFVKNLENVQGDERDIILFSIGYAPDEQGKVSMNFGPLNRNGGWRRLNVAITRARAEMHIFATIKTDQIDLNRTSAEGVAGLKAFLHFAEKGYLATALNNISSLQRKQHLSEIISKHLEKRGLNVKCNVGTSDFKIDIGIIHPDKTHQYIVGILIDGYYYYSAGTANDRELVIPSVLSTLGWHIHRIWTMDWYENEDKIIDSIIEKVEYLQTQAENEPNIVATEQPILNINEELPQETYNSNFISKQKPYISHVLTPILNANSETVYEFRNRRIIQQQIQSIVEVEAPISKSLLYKKVLFAWNTNRVGAKLDKYLERIIAEMGLLQILHHQPFYQNTQTINELDFYRSNDIEKRSIEDIAPEEIIVALNEAITQFLSIEEDELIRYLARTFGFAKVGRQIDILLHYAIDLAIELGKVKKENGRIKIGDAEAID